MANKKTVFGIECGDRLRRARETLAFEHATEFVEQVNHHLEPTKRLTSQKLSNYESGDNLVPIAVMLAVWRAFGITLEWVYGGEMRHLPMEMAEKLRKLRVAEPDPAKTGRTKAA